MAESRASNTPRLRPTVRPLLKLPLGRRDEPRRSPLGQSASALIVILAIAATRFPAGGITRVAIVIALLGVAMWIARVTGRRAVPARGWIVVDQVGISRVDRNGSAPVVTWAEPFGVSVLGNRDKSRVVLAFTCSTQARFVPVRTADERPPRGAPARSAFARIALFAEADLAPMRGDPESTLSTADAERLLSAVRDHEASAFERIFLTDARREPVVLDGRSLQLGARLFDLSRPVEWRAFTFREPALHDGPSSHVGAESRSERHDTAGNVAAYYQATWVRQAETEAVLVSPMGAELPGARGAADVRLAEACAEASPPRELRFAIDRVFMLPLREALNRAPRGSHASATPASGTMLAQARAEKRA